MGGTRSWPRSCTRSGSTRNYLSGSLIDVEHLVSTVDALLRSGPSLSMPSVTVAPRRSVTPS